MATSACSSSSLKKKFLSPGRRSIAPTGRLAGPDRWQAPFFIYLCCVSESEPSNASTCHLSGRRDSAFFGLFFWLENPARQRAPPPSCSVVLDTKNVLKKDLCPGEDRGETFLRSEPRVSFELSYLS